VRPSLICQWIEQNCRVGDQPSSGIHEQRSGTPTSTKQTASQPRRLMCQQPVFFDREDYFERFTPAHASGRSLTTSSWRSGQHQEWQFLTTLPCHFPKGPESEIFDTGSSSCLKSSARPSSPPT